MDTQFDDILLADLPFSERALACLAGAGIRYISQLEGKTLYDLPGDLRLRDLPLPTRAYRNFVCRDIQFISQLRGKSKADLERILGGKTAEEVWDRLNDLPTWFLNQKLNKQDSIPSPTAQEQPSIPEDLPNRFPDQKPDHENSVPAPAAQEQPSIPNDLPADLKLVNLPLPMRAQNCFAREGLEYAVQLGGKTLDDLLNMKNMGQKTALEIINVLSHLTDYRETIEKNKAAEDAAVHTQKEVQRIPNDLPPNLELKDLLLPVRAQNCFARGGIRFAAQLGGKTLEDLLVMKNMGQKTAQEVFSILTNLPALSDAMEQAQLLTQKKPKPMGLMEFVTGLPESRNRDMLMDRLRGRTLEEIGTENGLTRERVRQIIERQLRGHPQMQEDRYALLFNKYNITREDFALAFDEPVETYMYLESICKTSGLKKKAFNEDVLTDESIEPPLRKAAERAIYKNYVTVEGARIPKSRPALADFVVKRYCRNLTKFDDFVELYNCLLDELDMADDPSMAMDYRGYENRYSNSMEALWNRKHCFRYYNIPGQDFEELLSAVDLSQYENTEISALKIYRDYQALMHRYDIRDEYELHNLLKKIWPQDRCPANFKRMPTIEVGTVDQKDQVLSLLLEYAPISRPELAQKYEDAYGVKVNSVLANYLGSFDLYLHDGMYTITSDNLPEDQFQRMQQVLNKDFYTIADIKRLYLREFPAADAALMTPYAMKTLGFQVYPGSSGYVIRNTYPSAAAYFRWLLTNADIVDGREFEMAVWRNISFTNELFDLYSRYDIVEFSPRQYINIRRLEASGITRDDLVGYCTAVTAAVEPGSYFTIQSLHQDGFVHELEDFGFEDWFYSSLVCADRDRFSYQRIGGNRLFRRGTKSAQLSDLLCEIVEREQKIELYDLREHLNNRYGLSLSVRKLREIIRGTDLYYDTIMDTVYDTYDTYWEEI